ncbi:melanocortin-2 receptor accessory protein [Bos javanicus]|uniref:melanocortin-2 receptor accessory protein n=1 Tax=Bos javanicus TaxID=9906 RepID=UPI002AA773A8|nr:melanocortin-2 receptor accessory protein [Bos javanicus]
MSGTPPDLPPSPTALISEETLSSETHRHTWMILHKSAGPSPGELGAAPEGPPGSDAGMANRTNISAPYYSYEYYLDYLDLMPVDEKKLRANKHSIVIAFWVSLAAFVVFLFLILLYMSWSGSPQTRNATQQPPTCSWNLGLNLPLCIWRQPSTPGPHRAQSRNQTPEHPGCPAATTREPLNFSAPGTILLSSGN